MIKTRRFTMVAVLCGVIGGGVGCTEPGNSWQSEDVEIGEQTVVGGQEAWLDSAVEIQTTQCLAAPWHCGGLLISPTAVLTAAHCVDWHADAGHPSGVNPTALSTFRVAVGCHDITSSSCALYSVSSITEHDGNDPVAGAYFHDVAIVRLATAVSVKPTRLLAQPRMSEVKVGDLMTLYGWGHTESGQQSPVLRSVDMPISSISASEIIAQWPSPKGAMIKSGDSGGPGLITRDGESFALGVNSWSTTAEDCGEASVPGYFGWIQSLVADMPAQSYLPAAQIMNAVWAGST